MKISEQLAAFAATTRFEDIPPPVLRCAKFLMLDAVGIALAASRFDFARRAARALAGFGGGDCAVIGMPMRLGLRDAAVLNGMLVHGLDFDDTYLPGSMHLTASTVPCALGTGAAASAHGRDVLAALVVGMEVCARVSQAGKGMYQQAGFHPTGVVGTFGCALIASRLQGMSAEQMVLAQGIALSTACGSVQPMQDGTWTKRMHPGWAAASAITAAALAKEGYLAPAASYEGRFGALRIFLAEHAAGADAALIASDLGRRWELARTTVKLFPACHHTHAFMNAAIAIGRQRAVTAAEVRSIEALVAKECLPLICEPVAAKRAPPDGYTAQFSLQYTVARSLLQGGFGLADLEPDALADAPTLALAEKVEPVVDPNAGFPKFRSGELRVRLHDGGELRRRENILPDDPIPEAAIEEKFHRNAAMATSRGRAEEIRAAVLSIDEAPDVRRLAELLVVPAAA